MNRQEQIEQLAKEITSGSLKAVKKQICITKLSNLLLAEVNRQLAAEMEHSQNTTLPETDKYDSIAFAKAFRETLTNTYGKVDEKTGGTIPFLKLFRARYNLKLKTAQKDFLFNKNPEQTKLRKTYTADFLGKMADKYGLAKDERKKLLNFNELNDSRCISFLQHIGASAEDIAEYNTISQTTYRESLEPMNENMAEKAPASLQVIQQTLQEFSQKEQFREVLLDLLDKAKAMAPKESQQKTIEPFLPYCITLKVIGEYGYESQALNLFGDYMDLSLWQYCRALAWNTKTPKASELLSIYLSLRPDTVRKKMSIVKSFLLKVQSHSPQT